MNILIKDIFKQNWNNDFIFSPKENITYSYGDFFSKSLSYYYYFKKNNVGRQDKIAVILENSVELLAIYIASLVGNNIVVPIDPDSGLDYKNNILNSYDIKYIVESPIDKYEYFNIDTINLIDNIDFNIPYLLTHTSGTSGVTKGVLHSFNNLCNSALDFAKKLEYNDKSIFYHNLPMTYMAGILNQFIMPLVSKSKIVIGNKFSVQEIFRFWEIPVKYGCNVLWLNPTIISLLNQLDRSNDGIEYLKNNKVKISVGTAPLYEEVKCLFEKKYKTRLYRSYGLSELLFVTTEYEDLPPIPMSVGEILDNIDVKLDNGEILIDTKWQLIKYYNDNLDNYMSGSFYKTGDIGIIKNNQLIINGRKKDIIIKGGINISPVELENFLLGLNVLKEAAIIGIQDKTVVETIVLFYTADNTIDTGYINNLIVKHYGNSHKIDKFIMLDNIPKNLNGKIDKKELKKQYADKY